MTKQTKNNSSYFFTDEELKFIFDSIYYSKLSYEEKAAKYLSRGSNDYLEDYYENSYKPMQRKFENIRDKCTKILRYRKENKQKLNSDNIREQ